MLIDDQVVSLFELRNAIKVPTPKIKEITLDILLTALEEADDPRLIASFARHIATQADEISLMPLLKKYNDDLPMYVRQALWQAIAASARYDDEVELRPVELINLVGRVLIQKTLPFQLLVNVYRTFPDKEIWDMFIEEDKSQKGKAISIVLHERFTVD